MHRLTLGFRSFTLGVALAAMGGFGCSSGSDSGDPGTGGTTGAAGRRLDGRRGDHRRRRQHRRRRHPASAGSTGAARHPAASGEAPARLVRPAPPERRASRVRTGGRGGEPASRVHREAPGTHRRRGRDGLAVRPAGARPLGVTGAAGREPARADARAGRAPPAAAPAGATTGLPRERDFCADFETSAMPPTAIYKVNAAPGEWTRDFAVDTAQKHAGASSLRVKSNESGTSGSAYKMLAVPATTGTFWTRFWLRSDIDLGGEKHNSFTEASNADDPNAALHYEFGEDVGIVLHTDDRTTGGPRAMVA